MRTLAKRTRNSPFECMQMKKTKHFILEKQERNETAEVARVKETKQCQ